MSFHFWRRVKIALGVTLNLSKLGEILSFKPRDAKFTVASRDKRSTVSIPGTGLFTTLSNGNSGVRKNVFSVTQKTPLDRAEDRLIPGFFKQLITPDDKKVCQKVVWLFGGIENETSIHVTLMLYKAKTLRYIGLATAQDRLISALYRKKGRSEEFLRALSERILVYEDIGKRRPSRSKLKNLYAETLDYEDVTGRLRL